MWDLVEGSSGTGNSQCKSPEAGRCCLRSRSRQEAGVAGAEQAGRASTEAAIFIFYSKRRRSRESEGADQKTSPACPSPHKPWWPEATLCEGLCGTPGAFKQHGVLPPSLPGRDHRCAHSAVEGTAALSWVTHGTGFEPRSPRSGIPGLASANLRRWTVGRQCRPGHMTLSHRSEQWMSHQGKATSSVLGKT